MEKPIVAVVTPTRGRESLKDTIKSVKEQDYEGQIRHYIVTDGAGDSSPPTWLGEGTYKHIVRTERGGPGAARNTALHEIIVKPIADGPSSDVSYIAFLDDDDTYRSNAISLLVNGFTDAVDVVYGDLNFKEWDIRMPGGPLELRSEKVRWSTDWGGRGSLENGNYIPLPACLFTTKFFQKWGLFREDIGRCVDWELLARGEAGGSKFKHIPYVIGEANWVWGEGTDNISTVDPKKNFPPTSWARINTIVGGHYL